MLNIPNILSIVRIFLAPTFVIAYQLDPEEIKLIALVIYVLATATDFLDGFLARKLDMVTDIGRMLDPIGDKLMNIGALWCITDDGLVPKWVVIAVSLKEILMLIGGAVIHRKAKTDIPSSNIFGKLTTVVFFAVCTSCMVFKGISATAVHIMFYAAVLLMIAAFISYIKAFSETMNKARSK